MSTAYISVDGKTTCVNVYVQPCASVDRIEGEHNAMLKVRLSAPPERGKANKALIKLISKTLGIPKSGVTLIKGRTTRIKQLEISGISAEDIEKRLAI